MTHLHTRAPGGSGRPVRFGPLAAFLVSLAVLASPAPAGAQGTDLQRADSTDDTSFDAVDGAWCARDDDHRIDANGAAAQFILSEADASVMPRQYDFEVLHIAPPGVEFEVLRTDRTMLYSEADDTVTLSGDGDDGALLFERC